MTPEQILASLESLKDKIAVIEANIDYIPYCAAKVAVKAVAQDAWSEAFSLYNDIELSLEESKKASDNAT